MNETVETERPWYTGNAFFLLMTLTLIMLVGAFVGTDGPAAFVINALTIVAVLFALRTVTDNRLAYRFGTGLGVVLLLFSFAHHTFIERDTYIWDTSAVLVFFLIPVVALTISLARADRVTSDTIFAASCLYMLIGICFGLVFVLIFHSDPNAFTLSAADLVIPESSLIHFSFTTLTTVGYGAISPVSRVARALSDVEAILAQLYLAIVLARLVALEITHAGRDRL